MPKYSNELHRGLLESIDLVMLSAINISSSTYVKNAIKKYMFSMRTMFADIFSFIKQLRNNNNKGLKSNNYLFFINSKIF